MPTLQAALKSKTVWFNIILAVLAIVQGFVGSLSLTPVQQMYALIAIAVANVVLRAVTTQPLDQK